MFDPRNALYTWLDSPAADWLWNMAEDGEAGNETLCGILADFNICESHLAELSEYLMPATFELAA